MEYKVYFQDRQRGFMLYEVIIACLLMSITWYIIAQGVVQALEIEHSIERKMRAISCLISMLEKMRAGALPLKNQQLHEDGFTLTSSIGRQYPNHACDVIVRVAWEQESLQVHTILAALA